MNQTTLQQKHEENKQARAEVLLKYQGAEIDDTAWKSHNQKLGGPISCEYKLLGGGGRYIVNCRNNCADHMKCGAFLKKCEELGLLWSKPTPTTKDDGRVTMASTFKKGYFVLSEEILKHLKQLEVPAESRDALTIAEGHCLVYIMACTPGKKKRQTPAPAPTKKNGGKE
jgi:hypothetical protein